MSKPGDNSRRNAGAPLRILGIDPGSRITGYGVIEVRGKQTRHVASGCIRTAGDDFPARLHQIYEGVSELVRVHAPHEAAVERVFMARNADSAIKLGQARGAALCATFAGEALRLHEYSAREIKQAVVGRGGAAKGQVQMMIRMLLSLAEAPQADAADALAVAICHANMRDAVAAIGAARVTGGTRRSRRA